MEADSTHIDPMDWKTRARVELGETPELRQRTLKELEEKVREIKNFIPRTDENFLMRFLRAKKFNVDQAFKSYKKFHTIRLIDPERYMPVGVGPLRYKPAFDLAMGTQLKDYNPIDGAFVVIWRTGDWTPACGFDLSDIFTPTSMGGEYRLREDQAQVSGCHMVLDMGQMSLTFLRHFPFSAIKALIMTIQDGYPSRFKGFHIINHSSLWDYIWMLARPFLKAKIKDRVYLHGSNMKSLHKHICPSILPEEYGGQTGPFEWAWITGKLYERHDEYIRLSHYGFITSKHQKVPQENVLKCVSTKEARGEELKRHDG